MNVRAADVEDLPAVMTVFDGALLEADVDEVRAAIARGDVLVADEGGRILGACLLDGAEIRAIAVRRQRRGQGIGTMLVDAAAERRDRLVAEFDERVRPFWESLGFTIEPLGGSERYRGRYDGDTESSRTEQ